MGYTDDIPTTGTVTLAPHWPSVRAYVENIARSDLGAALAIAETMGYEAPDLATLGASQPQTFPCGCETRNGLPVATCCTPDTCAVPSDPDPAIV